VGVCPVVACRNDFSVLGFATEDHGDLRRHRSCSLVRYLAGGGVLQDVLLIPSGCVCEQPRFSVKRKKPGLHYGGYTPWFSVVLLL